MLQTVDLDAVSSLYVFASTNGYRPWAYNTYFTVVFVPSTACNESRRAPIMGEDQVACKKTAPDVFNDLH